jgi:ABC-type phosphate/phosphonate transport system substrate-binding protein
MATVEPRVKGMVLAEESLVMGNSLTKRSTYCLIALIAAEIIALSGFIRCDPCNATGNSFHLSIGFSTRGHPNANLEDARAAVNLLTRKIVGRNSWTGESHSYDSLTEMERDIRDKKVQLLGLQADEYLELRKKIPIDPIMVTIGDRNFELGLLLLVRKDSGIRTLRDLKNRSIVVTKRSSQYGNLNHVWLETLLMREGILESDRFFSTVKEVQTVKQVVMPVFFRQADACIVTRQVFELSVELNPQLGNQLTAIANIDKLAPGILVIDRILPEDIRQKLKQTLLTLHESPDGQQMMMLFQVKKLVPFRPEYLKATEALFSEYRERRKPIAGRKWAGRH